MRDFVVGDKVKFELSSRGTPRWNISADQGGIGKWAEGVVVEVPNEIDFRVEWNGGFNSWIWDQPSARPKMYSEPGYIQRVGEVPAATSKARLVWRKEGGREFLRLETECGK